MEKYFQSCMCAVHIFLLAHTRCWSFGSFSSYVCICQVYTCDIWYFCRRSRPLILDVILCRSAFSFHIYIYINLCAVIPFGIFKIKMVSGRFECVWPAHFNRMFFFKKKNLNFCRCAQQTMFISGYSERLARLFSHPLVCYFLLYFCFIVFMQNS